MLPIILGQAPSRLGDGRAFTGPSGEVLQSWAGVGSREELLQHFRLDNLLHTPLPAHPRPQPGEHRTGPKTTFTRDMGRGAAQQFVSRQQDYVINRKGREGAARFWAEDRMVVVALGKKVWESFGLTKHADLFDYMIVDPGLRVYRFPHPSGLNHQRNDAVLMHLTAEKLRELGGLPPID